MAAKILVNIYRKENDSIFGDIPAWDAISQIIAKRNMVKERDSIAILSIGQKLTTQSMQEYQSNNKIDVVLDIYVPDEIVGEKRAIVCAYTGHPSDLGTALFGLKKQDSEIKWIKGVSDNTTVSCTTIPTAAISVCWDCTSAGIYLALEPLINKLIDYIIDLKACDNAK